MLKSKKYLRLLYAHMYKKGKIRIRRRQIYEDDFHFIFYYQASYMYDFWVSKQDATILIRLNLGSRIRTNKDEELAFMLRNNMLLLVQ